jgi:HlyD family secretion protein
MDDALPDAATKRATDRPASAEPRPQRAARGAPRRNLAKWIRRGVFWLLGLGVVSMIVVAFLPKPAPVDVAKVSFAPLEVSIAEDGRTRIKDRYVVSAPLAANLTRIELSAGDAVEPGQVVARLTSLRAPLLDTRTRAETRARIEAARAAREQARAIIERIRASLTFAQRETERQQTLQASGATSPRASEQAELQVRTLRQELASAEFGARVAEHELEMALASLEDADGRGHGRQQLELTSPVKGQVLQVKQESEGMVQPGTPLLELGDPAAMEIVVDVLSADAVTIPTHAPARIERWGGPEVLRGHVRRVEPSAFTRISALGVEEQRVNVIIDLDDPHSKWQSLGDGYRTPARIVIWHAERVLGVPSSALFRRDNDWAVFAIRDGKARLTSVQVGQRNPERVEIRAGLQEGEEVVVHPSDRVSDGVSVVPR